MTAPGIRTCLDQIEARWQSTSDLFGDHDFPAKLSAIRNSLTRLENDADGLAVVKRALETFEGVPEPTIIGGMVENILSAETRKVPAEALKPDAKVPEKRETRQVPPIPEPPKASPGVKSLALAKGMEEEFEKMHPGEPVPNFIREKVARARALVNQHREAA